MIAATPEPGDGSVALRANPTLDWRNQPFAPLGETGVVVSVVEDAITSTTNVAADVVVGAESLPIESRAWTCTVYRPSRDEGSGSDQPVEVAPGASRFASRKSSLNPEKSVPVQYPPPAFCTETRRTATPVASVAVPQRPMGRHPTENPSALYVAPSSGNDSVVVGALVSTTTDTVSSFEVAVQAVE